MLKIALATFLGVFLLTGCNAALPLVPVGSDGTIERGYTVLGAKKPRFVLTPSATPTPTPVASATPAPVVTPSPSPVPTTTPAPSAPVQPVNGFLDHMDAHDTSRWHKADGWTNGAPFWCGWRADHADVGGSMLTLRVDDVASSGQPYSSGEYRTNGTQQYGRYEARMKAARGSGLVTGLFTYTGPSEGQPHDEIDIEILGQDPTRMQVNYFTNDVGGHEAMIELGFDASADFHTYAFEWSPSAIRWYVDGRLVHTETGARGALPVTPGRLMANLWPARGVDDWAGAYAGTPATAQFDYISYSAF